MRTLSLLLLSVLAACNPENGDSGKTQPADSDPASDSDPNTDSGPNTDSDPTDSGPTDSDPTDSGPTDSDPPADTDRDGVIDDEDCAPTDATVYPGAAEQCDGVDQDCDTLVDEDVLSTFYQDDDADGFGQDGAAIEACETPAGYAATGGDCDDADPVVSPAAAEVCNSLDDNCDGTIDEDLALTVWYQDLDGDGYGTDTTATACAQPAGYAAATGDCDDSSISFHPGVREGDCTDPTDYNCDGSVGYADADGDGFAACEDCDDSAADVNADGIETCDGVDEDCDGAVDDEAIDMLAWYIDADQDGYGSLQTEEFACQAPAGSVGDATDCDDADANLSPAANELCDGLDNDCDGETDEDAADTLISYADLDGDGFGDPATAQSACALEAGRVLDGSDCDDADRTASPAGAEVCDGVDNDCDGAVDDDAADAAIWYADRDADGAGDEADTLSACAGPVGYTSDGGDCDDTTDTIAPSAPEICDGLDNDCDTLADGDDPDFDPTQIGTWYTDADLDGFGDPNTGVATCAAPAGTVNNGDDCDDLAPAVNPAAAEICDDADTDEDCDGAIDDADVDPVGLVSTYADLDADGFGDLASAALSCDPPEGYVAAPNDCDDLAAAINPSAAEVCDPANTDEDCDGTADDADTSSTGRSTFYADLDADGFGDLGAPSQRCDPTLDAISDASDCDDSAATINPSATEICDAANTDEDCDGDADDADPSADASGFTASYLDLDGDNFGDADTLTLSCDPASGRVFNSTDCDDLSLQVNPAAAEICDAANTDEDCDGAADDADASVDASGFVSTYLDFDLDGYGDPTTQDLSCDPLTGRVSDNTDCDDLAASVNPGAPEVCDALDIDEDCDFAVDDADTSATGRTDAYADNDGDGFGAGAAIPRCSLAPDLVFDNTDCDDAAAAINPLAAEPCDTIDNDCDTLVDDLDGLDGGACFECIVDADCDSGICTDNACDEPSCSDGVANGDESDVDCGGVCPTCPDGDLCNVDADCDSGVCDGGVCDSGAAGPEGLVLNELDYDEPGTDVNEFVEIYNPTASVIDLGDVAVVFVNGSNNAEYLRVSLASAGTINPGQYLVVGSTTVSVPSSALAIRFTLSSNNIQNGSPDGVALIDTAALTVLDALSYEGDIIAASITGFSSTVSLVEGTGISPSVVDTLGGSLSRSPDGSDTDNTATDWVLSSLATPGVANGP